MFTGIIQDCVSVCEVESQTEFSRLTLDFPEALRRDLKRGASVSVSGVCLTVTDMDGSRVAFDAMAETLRLTTLGQLQSGQRVNVERSARFGDEIGGHLVSGHVHGRAQIVELESRDNNHVVTFEAPESLMDFIFDKGFIALDGTSLTVVDVERARRRFKVWFIPETLSRTSFGFKGQGEWVNIEIDQQTRTIVETVRAYLNRQGAEGPHTP